MVLTTSRMIYIAIFGVISIIMLFLVGKRLLKVVKSVKPST